MVWFFRSKTVGEGIRQLEKNSDRGVAIIAASILEEHITSQIKARWCNAPTTVKRMLQPEGPLGSFGPKIDLIFLMGVVSAQAHQDMVLIKKIRNRFAHHLDVEDFESPMIKAWCFDLQHFTNFVYTDEEMGGAGVPRKLFGAGGMNDRLKTSKGRYIVAVQVYSLILTPSMPSNYVPPPNLPTPFY